MLLDRRIAAVRPIVFFLPERRHAIVVVHLRGIKATDNSRFVRSQFDVG